MEKVLKLILDTYNGVEVRLPLGADDGHYDGEVLGDDDGSVLEVLIGTLEGAEDGLYRMTCSLNDSVPISITYHLRMWVPHIVGSDEFVMQARISNTIITLVCGCHIWSTQYVDVIYSWFRQVCNTRI